MDTQHTLKNKQQETLLFKRRLLVISLIILILLVTLLLHLANLQIWQHQRYQTLSQKNQIALIPINPTRGLIYDRNGTVLADNVSSYSLDVLAYQVPSLRKSLSELNSIIPLTQIEIKQFYRTLQRHPRFEPVPLKIDLTDTEVAKFAINEWRFPGMSVNARLLRNYPLNKDFSHVVGYMGRINENESQQLDPANYSATNYIGKSGIEKYYEALLHGEVGYQQVEINASGQVVRILNRIPPTNGVNIYLTIDSKLQQAAEKALGDKPGAVVALDPNTGEVLALVSEPSFDPNQFIVGLSNQTFHQLQTDSTQPLYNRATRGLYAPGSTIKPFIGLEGLLSGTVNAKTTIIDPGFFTYAGHTYRDWLKGGHGYVNLFKAIIVSCDTFYYNLAVHLGIKRIDSALQNFGFGQAPNIDLPDALPGVLPSPEWKMHHQGLSWYTGDTIITGIGQGYLLITPLQLAQATAILANHGSYVPPHLLEKMQYPNGKIIAVTPKMQQVFQAPEKYWDLVINAMQQVIRSPEGTGFRFGRNSPYSVAAKTGTAQVFSSEKSKYDPKNLPLNLRDNSLFIAFAPVDHPQIVVTVVAEHSEQAAAVARKVLDYYLINEGHWQHG